MERMGQADQLFHPNACHRECGRRAKVPFSAPVSIVPARKPGDALFPVRPSPRQADFPHIVPQASTSSLPLCSAPFNGGNGMADVAVPGPDALARVGNAGAQLNQQGYCLDTGNIKRYATSSSNIKQRTYCTYAGQVSGKALDAAAPTVAYVRRARHQP